MLDWMKAETGRSVKEENEERRRRNRGGWENRVRKEMIEIMEEVEGVRVKREKGREV
jgi:hypothetical protein